MFFCFTGAVVTSPPLFTFESSKQYECVLIVITNWNEDIQLSHHRPQRRDDWPYYKHINSSHSHIAVHLPFILLFILLLNRFWRYLAILPCIFDNLIMQNGKMHGNAQIYFSDRVFFFERNVLVKYFKLSIIKSLELSFSFTRSFSYLFMHSFLIWIIF